MNTPTTKTLTFTTRMHLQRRERGRLEPAPEEHAALPPRVAPLAPRARPARTAAPHDARCGPHASRPGPPLLAADGAGGPLRRPPAPGGGEAPRRHFPPRARHPRPR